MTWGCVFFAVGLPAPQGSKTRMPNGFMVEAGRKKLEPWRTAVANAARTQQERIGTVAGPVSVDLQFRFPPVKSDPHRARHCTKPDIDKLVRATLDSLVHARLLGDDSQVWRLSASKRYAFDGEQVGCQVRVESDSADEERQRDESKRIARAARLARKGKVA